MARALLRLFIYMPPVVCVAVYLLVVAGNLLDSGIVILLASVLLAFFVTIEFPRVARGQKIAGLVLSVIGLSAAFWVGDGLEALLEGLRRTQSFFLLFAAVAWLQVPVRTSPAMQAGQEWTANQPTGRRFTVLIGATHVLSATLSLAGVALVSGVARDQEDNPVLMRRLIRGIMYGFTAAACWSPFFVAMSVVLAIYPSLRWSQIAPIGLLAAFMLLCAGWALDRWISRRPQPGTAPAAPKRAPVPFDWRVLSIPVTLFILVVTPVEGWNLPIPVALAIVAPCYAAVWTVMQTWHRAEPPAAVGLLVRQVFHALPGLRTETFLFMGANLMGTGVAFALPPETVKEIVAALHLSPDLNLILMMAGYLLLSAAGLHPVVVTVLIGGVLPPEVIGISPLLMGTTLLIMWGLGTIVSPLSAVALYLSRASGVPPWKIAWLWNSPYALVGTVLAALFVVVARHLGLQ